MANEPIIRGDRVLRYNFRERVMHCFAAFSYIYCLLTGLAFWSPSLFWIAMPWNCETSPQPTIPNPRLSDMKLPPSLRLPAPNLGVSLRVRHLASGRQRLLLQVTRLA